MTITGIVLAAGAGTRMGGPKALMVAPDGVAWLAKATTVLLGAGCDRAVVVLGARAGDALPFVPKDAATAAVIAEDWSEGMSASLRAGLAAAFGDDTTEAALVTLVDLPGMPVAVAERVLGDGVTSGDLRQATYAGRPGHPVLIGRDHWGAIVRTLAGDHGARSYLTAHSVAEIDCSDLFDGKDVDRA